jgi:hypothetical protein
MSEVALDTGIWQKRGRKDDTSPKCTKLHERSDAQLAVTAERQCQPLGDKKKIVTEN